MAVLLSYSSMYPANDSGAHIVFIGRSVLKLGQKGEARLETLELRTPAGIRPVPVPTMAT